MDSQNKSDAEIKAALDEANVPTLLAVLAQISSDRALLEGSEMPTRNNIDGTHKMSPARQDEIRAMAFDLIKKLQRGDVKLPPLPLDGMLQDIASMLVGEAVPNEYIPMFKQDTGFVPSVEKTFKQAQQSNDYKALIIGAGLSGVCAAIHLSWAGIDYEIIEKNATAGGTWFENTYPDCGVDTPNHFYSYSFEPNTKWSSFYSKRDELHQYIEDVVDKYLIRRHTRFNSEVLSTTYQEDRKLWRVVFRNSKGEEETRLVNFVISAVGQINQPAIPHFKGAEQFHGTAFHSARWQSDCVLKDKNIIVIGSGASAQQFAPAIAKEAKSLTILQRSKQWIRILPDYHRKVSAGKQWILENLPYYRNWYRFKLFWVYGDGIWNSIHTDPTWRHPERSLNAENERHRRIYVQNLSAALGGNKELIEKVVPTYPPFAKRMLIDNHWCEMLQHDNVELINGGVKAIQENKVIDDKGKAHAADVIIYATGFKVHQFLYPMKIMGRGGKDLNQEWGDDARAYLGMTAPHFPNFFFFYGPNTNLGHGGSLIFHIECQARYITQCLLAMIADRAQEIEVKQDVFETYNKKVDREHNQMIWTHKGVNNWYKNKQGRVVSNSPWRLVDYWQMTQKPIMTDYKLKGV